MAEPQSTKINPQFDDKSGQSPAEGVAAWESDLASISEPPAAPAAPAQAAKPAPAPAKPTVAPAKPAPSPAAKAEPGKTPEPSKSPAPEGARKSRLDPDQLISFEGDQDVALPPDVVETLTKLDARDLRLQSAKLAQSLRANGKRLKTLEAELAEARAPRTDPEKETLSSQLTDIRRRNEDLERRLRQVAYTESAEYKEKYQVPFSEALDEAYSFVKEFNVADEAGNERQAAQADFDRLLGLPHGEAIKQAKIMFGDAAPEMLARRSKLIELQRSARKAVDKYKAEGADAEQQRLAQQNQQQEARRRIWDEANREIPKKYPKHFGEIPGDEEGNALLRKGYEIVDRVNDQSLPERDRIFASAIVRHRAAAYGRAANVAARLAKENAELKQIIKDYEESAPVPQAKDGGSGPKADGEHTDWGAEIDSLAQPVR